MGCWNGTCGVTQLPIYHGEPVVTYIIMPTGDKVPCDLLYTGLNGFSYSNEIYEPIFLPIHGKYDDYGCVEDIEEDWNTEIIRGCFEYDAEALAKEFRVPLSEPTRILIRAIERGKITARNTFGLLCQPALFMVRASVYEGLCNTFNPDWFNYPQSRGAWQREIDEAIEELAAEEEAKDGMDELERLRAEVRAMTGGGTDNFLLANVFGYRGYARLHRSYHEKMRELTATTSRSDLRSIMERQARAIHFGGAMSSLRKSWIPQAGMGSQEEVGPFNSALADIYREEVTKLERMYDDDDEG